MKILVTGGAGFLGSHLCRVLLERGDEVVCLDNFATSAPQAVHFLLAQEHFRLLEADVCHAKVDEAFDAIAHLACPASPQEYLRIPLETLAIGAHGSETVLEIASRCDARVVLASTSEVYGDPLEHPQTEAYWGNVNPVGPRSVYDESKRYAEALFAAHRRILSTNTGIVRIFNTYGPGLRPKDGRVVSNFVAQALAGEALTIYGEGSQTRSFCYVSDLVAGLVKMIDTDVPGPVNLGNPIETSVRSLAALVIELTGSESEVVHQAIPVDDPRTRRPDIARASELLHWVPEVTLREGLRSTIEWQRSLLPATRL